MAQGLLGGVLPAIYSGADQLKRGVYGLLTNPQEQAQRAAQSLLQSRAERQALMGQAFANPDRPFQVTDRNAMAQLGSDVLMGELGFAPAGITAWHGSPYKFNKFDMSKVGTGEGAQAYSHGMYFAEARPVAEGYAETVKNKELLGDLWGQIKTVEKQIDDLVKTGNLDEAFKLRDVKEALEFQHSQNNMMSKGYLYKTDIPDEYIPTMLDWDKPLGEQSDFVKKAISNLKKQVTPEMKMELGDNLNLLFGKDVTPNQFLNTWEIIHPSGQTGIGEKLLNEQGVKGVKYLDNQSRDLGTGTRNFVVFDPTDVKILERNDQPIESLLGK